MDDIANFIDNGNYGVIAAVSIAKPKRHNLDAVDLCLITKDELSENEHPERCSDDLNAKFAMYFDVHIISLERFFRETDFTDTEARIKTAAINEGEPILPSRQQRDDFIECLTFRRK